MPEEDSVEIKFRLCDGSDIGPFQYPPLLTVGELKEIIVQQWPKDKTITPKTANEVKLINSGKVLENTKTVGQCRIPFGELSVGAVFMHVVVQPSFANNKIEKKVDGPPRKFFCSCSIM